jgi:hypothetical protein
MSTTHQRPTKRYKKIEHREETRNMHSAAEADHVTLRQKAERAYTKEEKLLPLFNVAKAM